MGLIKLGVLKRKGIILYFILLCGLLMPSYTSTALSKEEGIQNVFLESEAQFKEINLNGHVAIENQFVHMETAKKWGLEISKELGMIESNLNSQEEPDHHQVEIKGKNQRGQTILLLIQSQEDEGIQETHIVMDIWEENHMIDVHDLAQEVNTLLEKYGHPEIVTCITGTFDGEIGKDKRGEILLDMEKFLDIREVESYNEEKMTSNVGYSPKIKEWITYNGKKVNIHMAMRYNAYEDKTYLWIGTPLILTGY